MTLLRTRRKVYFIFRLAEALCWVNSNVPDCFSHCYKSHSFSFLSLSVSLRQIYEYFVSLPSSTGQHVPTLEATATEW